MPNAERIAELQRLAYGAGTSDAERATAVAELGALRGGEPETPGAAVITADGPVAVRGPAEAADDAAPSLGIALGFDEPEDGHRPDRDTAQPVGVGQAVRWVVLSGAIALAVGFAAGWASGAAVIAAAGASAADADEDVVFHRPTESVPPSIPLEEAPAMAVFNREQVELDRTPAVAGDPQFDPSTQRRLATLRDDTAIFAARTPTGGLCLLGEHPEGYLASGCLDDSIFPPDGLLVGFSFSGGVHYEIRWQATGEVSVLRTPPA